MSDQRYRVTAGRSKAVKAVASKRPSTSCLPAKPKIAEGPKAKSVPSDTERAARMLDEVRSRGQGISKRIAGLLERLS